MRSAKPEKNHGIHGRHGKNAIERMRRDNDRVPFFIPCVPCIPWFQRLFLLAISCLASLPLHAADLSIRVRFAPAIHKEPFTGRVYLFTSSKSSEPRFGPNWFSPEPFFAQDVTDWQPDTDIVFGPETADRILGFPKSFSEWKPEAGKIQAVIRFNPWEREVGRGPGNGYSQPVEIEADQTEIPEPLLVNRLVPPATFSESRWVRLVSIKSVLLSGFHNRPVMMRAAVILPASYYIDKDRRYPTIYTIPGFSGTHRSAQSMKEPIAEDNPQGVEFLRVILDPSSPLGHHVFADSANNGPWGRALINELIPEIDRRVRTVPEPSARFLTGHSSGGWSSLWLQVMYPETFGGTWSTAPDPVDFRDFQVIDIYRPGEKMYVAADGTRRPIARKSKDEAALWFGDFDHMEEVLGPGGQLHSFEAVFSPRGPDGKPLRLWNRQTGEIDPAVAKAWEDYDIRLILERNWESLGPLLRGKLHVFMGDADTFYLEGATKLLKEALSNLGSDAVVEIHEDKNHGSLLTPELRTRIRREMAEAYLKHHPVP